MEEPAERLFERLLVLRCQTGDESAFAQLLERYGPRLRYYVRKMLGHRGSEAEDVLQEVWLDVFRGVGRLSEPAAFATWLYRIAHDRTRRLQRQRIVPTGARDDVILSNGRSTDFATADAEVVHAALNELPAEQREVLVLRFLEDLDYEAISQIVGSPVGTVRSRLHYAKRELRIIIERQENHP